MVSRRTFLAGTGALTAGGFGLIPAQSAAAAGAGGTGDAANAARRLLPAFGRPEHLHYGDVSKLSGGDQTLLTTLQGVVNRSSPELYFLFSPGGPDGVDARWLRDTGLPTTRYADPLELVAKYRHRVRGAIVHDPDVIDSLNVATTLAGLENAVVADAAQAKAHGLRIVQDLRGKFDGDRVKTYRWQLENLFPRCTHQLLTGLPPTMVVQAENLTWHEIARETRQIRDSSNRGSYTLDVSPALGKEAVYVRFGDSFGDDGWGASVASVSAKANGVEIANFLPGTDAETPFLFDGLNSSIGGEGNRFSDGGGYFIYKFTPPAGTTSLTVTVEMWNQYLVTATDTAPTRVEAFPYFRDYVVATKALVSWLPPNGPTGDLLKEHFDKVAPTAPYAGWFSNDVAGEWSGVDLAAQGGVEVLPADFYMNGTVHSGVSAPISDKVRKLTPAKPGNKVFLTLTFGEGDNVQYCQRHMRDLWDDPHRGEAPVNWTVSPLLAEVGPALFSHYQRTATKNDLLICGPSGAGYTYPGAWPADEVDEYMKLSGRFMRSTGMDLVYAYNHRENDKWVPFSEEIGRSYAEHTPLRGIIQSWEAGDLLVRRGGIPVIGNFSPPGKAAEYKAALDAHIADWDGKSPLFIAGGINAWSWTPTDVAELAKLLKAPYELLLGNAFFDLLNRTL
ncbi:GxGYxY motif-containing protein [Kribbella orskensis]|uniref:GxGYxY motif-containing protein n=1 Tax=Kribbella orskensis TaxID=2512216 RepID=A0ABY2BND1_9ACTN|nr:MULTISPECIES: GxGYxYP domain-containing protein [Kribbella]TCN42061.1 GxGYxY motif-containing protein [Kribbella sp. VKM Ac-2500]TCO25939.1 GxGYxY motif-containing protein [Kribbella orskensis]